MRKIKVCFISLNSYPLFEPQSKDYFGGAEVQISFVIKELIKDAQFEVILITGDYGQKQKIKKANLTIYKCFRKGSPILNETLSFLRTLKKVNADFYVERTINEGVGMVSFFCKLFGKKFVYMIAHNWDCSWAFKNVLNGFQGWLYYLGLKMANLIIAQSKDQQKKLLKNFGLNCVVLPSIIRPLGPVKRFKKEFILWVGRADKWKRPDIFINLAKNFPKQNFIMICQQGNDIKLFKEVKNKAAEALNLKFFSFVPFEKVKKYFQKAKVFVNTSQAEGFPNTFLQAGLYKSPILSWKVNPDKFITKYYSGFWANSSIKKLKQQLKTLLENPKLKIEMGENNFQYITKNHSPKNIQIFKEQLKKKLP